MFRTTRNESDSVLLDESPVRMLVIAVLWQASMDATLAGRRGREAWNWLRGPIARDLCDLLGCDQADALRQVKRNRKGLPSLRWPSRREQAGRLYEEGETAQEIAEGVG